MTAALQSRRSLLLAFAGLALAAALVGNRVGAMPFSAIGENVHVYLLGGMSVTYDDNVFLSNVNKQSDLVTHVNAGVELEFGSPDTPNSARLEFAQNWFFYHNRPEYDAKHWSPVTKRTRSISSNAVSRSVG